MSELCNMPTAHWVLLISAIVLGIVGACVIRPLRVRQLNQWNLWDSLEAPSTKAYMWTLGIFAIVSAVLLPMAVFAADACAPEQKWANVRFWWLGIAIGAFVCLVSLYWATKLYREGKA